MKNTPEVPVSSEHMISLTDLSPTQKSALITAISDLINLPAARLHFTAPRDGKQGLHVCLNNGLYGEDFNLFQQRNQ